MQFKKFWKKFKLPADHADDHTDDPVALWILDASAEDSVSGFRKLQVSVAGRWYIALTILMGVTALASSNNILYLIESLLLSGLILSGILSEQILSGVRLRIQLMPSSACDEAQDLITLTNTKKQTLYCIEVGEWKNGKFFPLAFFPALPPHRSLTIKSKQIFPNRGHYHWSSFAIATPYPFGFAKKIRLIHSPGRRIIWPSKTQSDKSMIQQKTNPRGYREPSFLEGEVRPYLAGEDLRQVVWTLSQKTGDWQVRPQAIQEPETKVILDLNQPPGKPFELQVSRAAQSFYLLSSLSTATLLIRGKNGTQVAHGKHLALNQLALAQSEFSEATTL